MSPENFQRFVDQHPSLFAAIFPFYFVTLWLLMGTVIVISLMGGWFSLSKLYRTRIPFKGEKLRRQSGQMRWLTNYGSVLTLGTNQEGLYLASMFLFRFMQPPLLIPWGEIEIKVRKSEGWFFEYVTFTLGANYRSRCEFEANWRKNCGTWLEIAGPWKTPDMARLCRRVQDLKVAR